VSQTFRGWAYEEEKERNEKCTIEERVGQISSYLQDRWAVQIYIHRYDKYLAIVTNCSGFNMCGGFPVTLSCHVWFQTANWHAKKHAFILMFMRNSLLNCIECVLVVYFKSYKAYLKNRFFFELLTYHDTIRIPCKFQNWKLPCQSKNSFYLNPAQRTTHCGMCLSMA